MDRQIRNMDAMLRCPVCFEFFNTAMIVNPCSHNFCSLCIRRHLEYEQKCPACRHPCSSSDLKNNRLLDEFVKVFSQISEGLLKLATAPAASGTAEKSDSATQRRNTETRVSPNKQRLGDSVKKRHENGDKDGVKADDENGQEDEGDDDDDDFAPPPAKRRKVEALSPKKQPTPPPTKPTAGEGVDCPLCQRQVNLADINQHIDSGCTTHIFVAKSPTLPIAPTITPTPTTSLFFSSAGLSGPIPVLQKNNSLDSPNQSSALKSLLARPPEKRKLLPLLCYHLLTDKQLRKAIKDSNLNPNGDRNALIWRHKEYTLRYNSECDSLNPMSQEDLMKEIDIAERTLMNQKKKQKPMIFSNPQSAATSTVTPPSSLSSSSSSLERSGSHSSQEEETPDVKANENYLVEHKKDFDSLVASIRERMRKQKEAAAKGSERPTTRTTTETTTDVEEIIKIDDDDDEIKGEASSAKGALVSSTEEGIHSSGQEGNVAAFPRSQDSENSSTWSSQSSANGEAGEKRKRKKRSSQPDRPEGAEPDSPVSPEGGRRRSARLTKENPTD